MVGPCSLKAKRWCMTIVVFLVVFSARERFSLECGREMIVINILTSSYRHRQLTWKISLKIQKGGSPLPRNIHLCKTQGESMQQQLWAAPCLVACSFQIWGQPSPITWSHFSWHPLLSLVHYLESGDRKRYCIFHTQHKVVTKYKSFSMEGGSTWKSL